MKSKFKNLLVLLPALCFINTAICRGQIGSSQTSAKSIWVYQDKSGKLIYKKTEKGDRIMDFSHAGYMGGGVAIPVVPVRVTVRPTGSDDTENIQKAINDVSAMALSGEFRGAVLMAPGTYTISKTITVSASGVVLRGSSTGNELTSIIQLKGKPFNAISVRAASGSQGRTPEIVAGEKSSIITDSYVPSGAEEFTVDNTGSLKPGDYIRIQKPVTARWIEFMQMHNLVRDGKPQTWIKEGDMLITERKIVKITGKKIFLDVPLSDSFDSQYFSGKRATIIKIDPSGRLRQSGIEDLHIISPLQAIPHSEAHFTALRINGEDCWARNLIIEETMNSVAVGGKRITLENVTVKRKALHQGSSRPAEFAPNGSQVLVDRCRVIAENVWFLATGSGQAGPIVILNCEFIGDQRAESHQRWSTGMLYDNVKAVKGGIDFRNRGSMGSGHGWSMGWGVAWNCTAKDFIIQNPPGACNWMIGCIGESKLMPRPFDKEPMLPQGIIDSPGVHVSPESLYLAQLKERLGEQALINIGYK